MGIGIDEFKGAFNLGGARSNLFKISWPYPNGGGDDETLSFFVKAGNFPTSTITPIDVFYQGRTIKVAGTRPAYTDWTVTIMNDEDFKIRKKLENWFQDMNHPEQNVRKDLGLNNYKVDKAYVEHYKKTGEAGDKYEFYGIFPNTIGEIALDWGTDTIQEYTVTWSFDYFLPAS